LNFWRFDYHRLQLYPNGADNVSTYFLGFPVNWALPNGEK